MSAFIVSDLTISAIVKGLEMYNVSFAAEGYSAPAKSYIISLATVRKAIGQYLLNQNYNSVNYRYKEKEPSREFVYHDIKNINPGMIVGAINCYNYQTCEAPIENQEYFETQLYFSLQRLKDAILDRYITRDGYEITWEVYPEDIRE